MQRNRNSKGIFVLVANAVLIAVYVVLSTLAISIGSLKITFEHFPVVISAIVFGPVSGMLVGGLGELVNQLLTFGITPTTALWILPIVFRGFAIGIGARVFRKKMHFQVIMEKELPVFFIVACVITGVISSCLNTVALYVDSKMVGYYTYALVFGALAVRLILGAVTSVVIGIATKPILHALRHARLI